MKEFSTVELLRDFKEVSLAAARKPVAITQHRKPRYVLMSYEDFVAIKSSDPRRVYAAGEVPDDLAEMFLPEIDRLIAAGDDDEK